MRKFEVAKGFEDKGINLPKRGTKQSAGYDLESAETVTIPSIWDQKENGVSIPKGTLVSTGIKVYCEDNEYVGLANRSSSFNKQGLMLANNFAVIDQDYADNPKNDGHIMLNLINFGFQPVTIEKGERIAQAIFHKFEVTDDDKAEGDRTGGFGSTNENN